MIKNRLLIIGSFVHKRLEEFWSMKTPAERVQTLLKSIKMNKEQLLYLANFLYSKWVNFLGKDKAVESILVVKWDEIGDMATSLHVFPHLKQSHPEAQLTVLCKPAAAGLLKYETHIDELIHDLTEWNSSFDLVVELRGTWKTLFKSVWCRPQRRVDRGTVRFRNRKKQLHEVDTNFEVIKPIVDAGQGLEPKIQTSEVEKKLVSEYLEKEGIEKYAVFHIGANKKLRRWSPERFAKLSDFLNEELGLNTVLIGVGEDLQLNDKMVELCTSKPHRFENVSLLETSELISNCEFFIGNESGPLQIASILEVPLIALFGPGVKDVFYPRGKNSKVFHPILDCNPCNQIDCKYPDNPCIDRIELEEVKIATKQLLYG